LKFVLVSLPSKKYNTFRTLNIRHTWYWLSLDTVSDTKGTGFVS
jgi:hypothetical protein